MKGFLMKKKLKGEHKTWAAFRYIPNDAKGAEFMRMFKKYRNPEVIGGYHRRGRKPVDCGLSRATEFSLYVYGYSNPILNTAHYAKMAKHWEGEYTKFLERWHDKREMLKEVEDAHGLCQEMLTTATDLLAEWDDMSIWQLIVRRVRIYWNMRSL
jgi:hypothetical protein